MVDVSPRGLSTSPEYRVGTLLVAITTLVLCLSPPASAQNRDPVTARAAEEGIRWQELSPAQRAALKPLERDWAGISAAQKLKWMEIADRFPSMKADERNRIQARMSDWARMTPEQRGQARANYQKARQAAPSDRQAQWEAYQSLSPDVRRQLADRASPAALAAQPEGTRQGNLLPLGQSNRQDLPQPKSNLTPNPVFAPQARPVAPVIVQARPGATTTLVTKPPSPPSHQQTGLPKIAATPNFVDKSTLLPQRGPQGAAVRTPPASAAESSRRR